ncbi:kinase-like domain-containing protein [Gigaspora rosea]|uniref:Kinase-like domain-containing protein n=1 Tax=Gigaspora rosea TaxID=44941 RepID=A0A397WCF8_9GLOM|nr:kinase-like domain-containing protein [Gigaspora rosea]
MKWKDKIAILLHIASDLQTIHSKNRIHRDLHSGNILQNSLHDAYIADLGLSISTNMTEHSNRCGVLPYMAPEVLKNEPYITASDIYSFGIIMWEISAGKPNYQNNIDLICNGLRPKFSEEIPSPYTELANRCMEQIAYERPSARDIQEVLNGWTKTNYYVNIFEKADKKIDNFKAEHTTSFCENSIFKHSSINSEILFILYLNDA